MIYDVADLNYTTRVYPKVYAKAYAKRYPLGLAPQIMHGHIAISY
jgi:hypothetical protein